MENERTLELSCRWNPGHCVGDNDGPQREDEAVSGGEDSGQDIGINERKRVSWDETRMNKKM